IFFDDIARIHHPFTWAPDKGQARSKEGEINDEGTEGDANLYSNLAVYAEDLESKIKKLRVAQAKAEVRQGNIKKECTIIVQFIATNLVLTMYIQYGSGNYLKMNFLELVIAILELVLATYHIFLLISISMVQQLMLLASSTAELIHE
ncbi:hypothetical protein ACJX0J_022408, partial [Zea mays]